jgi:Tol biopolymer transport system component
VVRPQRLSGRLELIPTQAGETRTIEAPRIEPWGIHWFSDGVRLLFTGNEQNRPIRAWVIDTRTGARRAITPEGIGCWLVSPDGLTAACARPGGEGYFYPVEGGEPRPLTGFASGDHMRQWSADGRYLYVSEKNALPPRVHKIDVQTGSRTLWRELELDNPAGVMGTVDPAITPDGTTWAWAVLRHVNDLFVVQGLR